MRVIEFRRWASVSVEEEGGGAPIHALAFEPTAATAQRLADHKLVFRPRRDGFELYAQYNPVAGNARVGAPATRASFVFGIRLQEPDFLARYHPDLGSDTGPNLYLTNLDAKGAARAAGSLSRKATVEKADAARIVARHLIARADLTAKLQPARLKVTDRFRRSRTVADVPVHAVANASTATVAIDLADDLGAVYVLAPQPADKPRITLFADDELAGRGAFGVLELVADPAVGPEPAGGRKYTARFRRRSEPPVRGAPRAPRQPN